VEEVRAVTDLEFAARLAVGIACGVGIGLERQWRQRLAGLRTTALVATGACLFVILSEVHSSTANDDRIAAQIVSGIGFLGAGVIIRDGLGIPGAQHRRHPVARGRCRSPGWRRLLRVRRGRLGQPSFWPTLFLRSLARRVDRSAGVAADAEVATCEVCRKEVGSSKARARQPIT
jgi:MgtC family